MLAALKKYSNHEDGFTLIELLIVVLIIGILAAIAIPVYLGIQNQAHKSAVKGDVNIAVKQVQVAITEGTTTVSQYGTKNGSDRGETVQVKASTTSGATTNDFMVIGTETKTGGAIDYTYQYDSVTGQFSDSDTNVALGGSNTTAPLITSAKPTSTGTVGTAYTYTVVGAGTPSPTFTATGLPTGLGISSSGAITGTPTTAGAFNYTITATNGTTSDATQGGTITIAAPGSLGAYTYNFENSTTQGWAGSNSGTNVAVASNINGHTKALYITAYLTNNNGNYMAAAVNPAGSGITFTAGHTYSITYSYYMLDTYDNYSGKYVTDISMTAGQSSTQTYTAVKGAWTTRTVTWTQTSNTQPFTLTLLANGYNGAYNGMYIDDVTIQSTN